MTFVSLLQAITTTAQAHDGGSDADQLICNALRGIVARARRYEAQTEDEDFEVHPYWDKYIRKIIQEELEKFTKPNAV